MVIRIVGQRHADAPLRPAPVKGERSGPHLMQLWKPNTDHKGSASGRIPSCWESTVSLVKRGTRYYAVLYDNSGRQRWFACGEDKRAAKRRHDQLSVELRKGDIVEPSRIKFEQYCTQWLHDYARVRLKQSTYKEYESYTRVHLVPFFGQLRLCDITSQKVQQYIALKADSLSAKTVRNHLVVMKKMMATAVDWQLLQRNPATAVTLPRVLQPEIAFLTPEQMHAMIDATPEESAPLIVLACLTGMRKGEIIGLKWDCIDFDAGTVTVKRSVYAALLQEPKSKRSVRVLPMPNALSDLLAIEFERLSPHQTAFVFGDGKVPMANSLPNRILARALQEAGLPSITFHGLRHSFVAAHIAAGTPMKAIQEMAGHASITTTMDRYGHLLPHTKEEAGRAIQDAIFGGQ